MTLPRFGKVGKEKSGKLYEGGIMAKHPTSFVPRNSSKGVVHPVKTSKKSKSEVDRVW